MLIHCIFYQVLDVTLTPPPDFTIREIFTEKTFYVTGDAMVITWTVMNDGYRSPYAFYWIDSIVRGFFYISIVYMSQKLIRVSNNYIGNLMLFFINIRSTIV